MVGLRLNSEKIGNFRDFEKFLDHFLGQSNVTLNVCKVGTKLDTLMCDRL